MGGWIGIGLGAAAALCPLPHHGGAAVAMDHTAAGERLVVCAPDAWVDISHHHPQPRPHTPQRTSPPPPQPTPPPPPRPSALPKPAPMPPVPPTPPPPVPPLVQRTDTAAAAPKPPAQSAPLTGPPPASAPAPAPVADRPKRAVAKAFRWVPRPHYTGGPSRPVPAGMPTTMTTVVVTLPGILAAAALRPRSRRG
ncbi:hypothetical protein AB0Q95_29825 [Streptomyces sp. NPDC059900]|uniref:hypothetical protein n=1 Tax=Streptomyces sp. NPDC059900 TaxID=3155816 RepID=UPI00342B72BC